MSILNISAFISLIVQFITGLVESTGLYTRIDEKDKILQDILLMELIVQSIEFIFYMYLVYKILNGFIIKDITLHRYVDWFITTPTMLISFVLFFKYLKDKERNIRFFESINEEKTNIIKLVLANALMLLLGFLGELNIINKYIGVTLGFLPFAYVFKILYSEYAKHTELAKKLFYLFFGIWGMYGVAAVLPFEQKNTAYNILDLFAKNFYGLFLYAFIINLNKTE
jgi:bacteriorhodopsin